MAKQVQIIIDGKKINTEAGKNIIEVAKDNCIYIPTLCYFSDMNECLGTCRVCTIKWKRHYVSGCTLKAEEGMELTVHTDELKDLRKGLIELLFVEGNHFCPGCEKSGDCDLQALAYRFEMTAPRFPYRFNNQKIDYSADKIILEHNRCILCKRCTNEFEDQDGQKVFSFKGKGSHIQVEMDLDRANKLNDELIDKAVELCPVGAILKKGKGFDRPYGERKYDNFPIGYDIEHKCDGEDHE